MCCRPLGHEETERLTTTTTTIIKRMQEKCRTEHQMESTLFYIMQMHLFTLGIISDDEEPIQTSEAQGDGSCYLFKLI